MRLTATSLLALLLGSTQLAAQAPVPFDMAPEKPAQTTPGSKMPDAAASQDPVETQAVVAPTTVRRYIAPFTELILAGEQARRSWAVYITPEQAASRATLNLSYQNAIIVAPESSRLTVKVNGVTLMEQPVESPDRATELKVAVPANVLRPGLNEIALSTDQRHRTDCTIESTYELWTQIDTAKTFLTFEGKEAGRFHRIDDLRAVGVDDVGATTFKIISPTMDQPFATAQIMRLSQALGLLANMPNQSFDLRETGEGSATAGSATIVVGPAAEIAPLVGQLPTGAQTSPVSAMVSTPLDPSTLVVTGPDWPAVETAVNEIARQFDRPAASQRSSLSSQTWVTPDVPLLRGQSQLSFAALGVPTQEFSGRRLRTDFRIGLPSDFYADSYGQIAVLLDAAYSSDVQPGSHIDIYVNDNIAATVPITTTGGEILRHLPIKVAMRHLRPGDNKISIEAVLMTSEDAVCAPGQSASATKRFVLFDTSELVMPEVARIGRTPNLAAVSGTGFPYNRAEYATPLLIDRTQPEVMSAAATLLARMAVVAGRPIPVDTTSQAAAVADRNAIFVGAISQVPPTVLAQVGVANDGQSTWGETVASIGPDTDTTFDEWRSRLRGSGWRGQFSSFEEWMSRTFNVSTNSFRILPGPDPLFTPQGSASLVVAQQASPEGDGTWTLVTAPSASLLNEGVRSLTQQSIWRQMGGRVTTVDAAAHEVETVPISRFSFVETQPFSLANYRLIVANWMSANALSYAMVVILLAIGLGFATAHLLGSLGRRQ